MRIIILQKYYFLAFLKLLVTAGVCRIGALAIAYYINDIQQKINDQEDKLQSLRDRYAKVRTDYEDLATEETSVCDTVGLLLFKYIY